MKRGEFDGAYEVEWCDDFEGPEPKPAVQNKCVTTYESEHERNMKMNSKENIN